MTDLREIEANNVRINAQVRELEEKIRVIEEELGPEIGRLRKALDSIADFAFSAAYEVVAEPRVDTLLKVNSMAKRALSKNRRLAKRWAQ